MEVTDVTFLESTFHRAEKGGYEKWSFKVNGRVYNVYCDIRIPGLISTFYEEIPKDKEKVNFADIVFTTNKNALDLYNPSLSTPEEQEAISKAVIDILTNKIKTKRDYKYLTFVFSKENESFFRNIYTKICTEAPKDIQEKSLRLVNNDLQLMIDAGQWHCLVGELK